MPEPRDHADNRGIIESVLRYIPGFRGYLEKEYRRESDELQRTWLAERLERSKRAIDNLSRPLADAGKIDLLPQVERLRTRLDKLIWNIRSAMQGYSGFFDLVNVNEGLLDRVYEHDLGLMQQVDTLATTIEQLPDQPYKLAALVGESLDRIDDLQQQWDLRSDMLKGLE